MSDLELVRLTEKLISREEMRAGPVSGSVSGSVSVPILEQPRQDFGGEKEEGQKEGQRSGENGRLKGLSSLAVANSIHIQIDKQCCGWDWDVHYNVRNTEGNSVMFRATEDHQWCSRGNLKNVVVRDQTNTAVARVCYKEKACCSNKLVLGIYAPPDLLVGSVEEDSSCLVSRVEFRIRNADGAPLFSVLYHQGSCLHCLHCGSYFTVKSGEGDVEVAKILEKTSQDLRLQFKTKLDITGKIILTGFCIGLIHKVYHQPRTEELHQDRT